jgi:hypothetical protein
MKEKWYNNDWFVSFVFTLAMAAGIVGNFYYHGGHIVW